RRQGSRHDAEEIGAERAAGRAPNVSLARAPLRAVGSSSAHTCAGVQPQEGCVGIRHTGRLVLPPPLFVAKPLSGDHATHRHPRSPRLAPPRSALSGGTWTGRRPTDVEAYRSTSRPTRWHGRGTVSYGASRSPPGCVVVGSAGDGVVSEPA